MTRCSTGRATQKYRGNGTDLSDILETPGDIIYADAAVSAENLVISGTTGDVLKVSASGIPEWGTSTSQWITSGDDISYSLGHVGIGTTSPDANLHVTGNTFVSTDLGLGGTLTMGNVLVEALHELSAITATGNVTPHVIEFTNPTTGLVTTGNVGIKTSTPLQTLEVNGSIGINHNGVGGYTFHTSTGALRAGIHSTGGNHLLFKAGANNERMRLLAGGQLGIGTSTPSKPLTVDGNVHIPSGSSANSGSFPQNSVTRSIYFGGISQSGSMLQSKTAIVSAPWTQYGGTQSWGRHGLHFCVDSVADNGNVELGQTKMCINYLGNVGIGSWSTPNPLPQTMASVHGGRVLEGRDASGFEFIAASSDTTNQPGQFNGAFLIKNMDANGSTPHYSGMAAREGATTTAGQMDLLFYSGRDNYENNTPQMVIDPNGDVGIGTSTPGYTLDVAGDINFTGEIRKGGVVQSFGGGGSGSSPWVTSGNDISYTTGRVGVGTTSPDANLHVEGNVYMSSNLNVGPTVSATLAYQQQGKIQASDAQGSDYFGYSVSISGDGNTAIIGAYQEDDTGFVYEAGAAYIFTRSSGTWTQQQKIQASDRQAGDRFGYRVSLSSDGNTALIGAYREDTGGSEAGAAYIFTRSSGTWTQQQKIQASDIQAIDYFGYSVSLSSDGNTALIGAYREDTGASNAGAAYIFTRSSGTWTQQQKIQASDIEKSDYFGHSVSLSGDGNTALVGAIGEDTGATDAGAAYVFTLYGGTWTQQQKIQASDAQASDNFGYSVSLSSDGNTALIGAYREDTGASDAGAAYIFTRSSGTWTQQQKIQASDAQAYDSFGYSVSLSSDGNTALVGARLEDTGASDAGAAYIFTRSSGTWTQQQKIQASDAQAYDEFGHSVSLSSDGNTAIIGAYREDTVDTDAGAAYIFTSTSTPGSGTVLCVNTTLSRVGIATATPNYTLDVAGDLTCSGTMRHRAFAFYARASGGQIVAGNGILSDSNSTITTEFDYTPAGTASSNGFRSSGGASNNQGTYFAPLDGIYHVSCKVRLNDSSTAQQEIQWYIKRTNGNEDQWESFEMWISPADGGGRRATMSSTIVKLAKDEGIFPRADNPTTSLSSATFGGHFLGTY